MAKILHVLPEVLYVLCAAAAILCTGLLASAYRRFHVRALLWMAICFIFFSITSILVYVDLVIFPGPEVDLEIPRKVVIFVGMSLLVWGLIWDVE